VDGKDRLPYNQRYGAPAGNVTGVSWFAGELVPKRLGLIHEVVPIAAVIGFLVNLDDSEIES
jgi:ABC-type uncharacterized transport system substrate-binding protein